MLEIKVMNYGHYKHTSLQFFTQFQVLYIQDYKKL